ncbi:MAG: ParB/RepB/Spo0J family partition protein [Bacteroidetes bacterium]|nr:ParB/RepB/Spo0J family partition protein [Bacteroidota bacterium]
MIDKKKGGLGRGLGALLTDDKASATKHTEVSTTSIANQAGVVIYIPLAQIEVNPFQPRSTFDTESLEELADSIRIHGVIQPITVRKIEGNKYQLIAGERRLRASKLAGRTDIPAYVRLASDQESIEIALIENIQREDLNPLEIAINYKRLMDECDLTQDKLSERLGKNRSTVTNFIRLLKLPPDIQAAVRDNRITMGHAKALLAIDHLPTLLSAFKETVEKGLSVRQTEELVRGINLEAPSQPSARVAADRRASEGDIFLRKLQDQISSSLGTRVSIIRTKEGKGEIAIKFYNDTDLERLVELLTD